MIYTAHFFALILPRKVQYDKLKNGLATSYFSITVMSWNSLYEGAFSQLNQPTKCIKTNMLVQYVPVVQSTGFIYYPIFLQLFKQEGVRQ